MLASTRGHVPVCDRFAVDSTLKACEVSSGIHSRAASLAMLAVGPELIAALLFFSLLLYLLLGLMYVVLRSGMAERQLKG
jgi:hypothetical protein